MIRSLGLVSFLICLLAGCSWSSSEQKKDPSTIAYSIAAEEDLNPNQSGEATALEIQVFELEDDSMFLSADYDHLVDNAKKALKSNYVDHRDYVLLPAQFKFVDEIEVNKKTRFIGVMARYAELNASQWKKVIPVKAYNQEYYIMVLLKANEVKLFKME